MYPRINIVLISSFNILEMRKKNQIVEFFMLHVYSLLPVFLQVSLESDFSARVSMTLINITAVLSLGTVPAKFSMYWKADLNRKSKFISLLCLTKPHF